MNKSFPVEHAFALCHTGYPERIEPLRKEMARVCMLDCCDFVFTNKNPFDKVFMNTVSHVKKIDESPGFFNLTMGHYSILKAARAMSLDRILVVEDDCRFLKNTDEISSIMSRAPREYDILILDKFMTKGKTTQVCDGWSTCSFWRSAAAFCINTKAMDRLIGCVESCLKDPPEPMRGYDSYFDTYFIGTDLNIYMSNKNIAIQCTTPRDLSSTNTKYAAFGVDVSEYAQF